MVAHENIGASEQLNAPLVCSIILAGGSGERLWPLSRKHRPKQFLSIDQQCSLLEATVERMQQFIEPERTWIICAQNHAEHISPLADQQIANVVIEPTARNTAPAVYLACRMLESLYPLVDPVVFIAPSDHYIPNAQTFAAFASHVIDVAANENKIVLLGVRPSFPATTYGYIEYAEQASFPYAVTKFHEKPSQEVAQQYVASEHFLWNAGMVCARISVLLSEFELHAPELAAAVDAYAQGEGSYEKAPSISFDHAVLEKSSKLAVFPVDFIWSDVGSLDTFLSLREQYGNQETSVIAVDAQNNVVDVEHKLVALVGVEDLCIVERDGILLIAKKDETEKIKTVLETLKQNNASEYL